jgi:hypothetical protein
MCFHHDDLDPLILCFLVPSLLYSRNTAENKLSHYTIIIFAYVLPTQNTKVLTVWGFTLLLLNTNDVT